MTYALCLAGAACTHLATLFAYGLSYDYGGRPGPVCTYWTALTLLDPIAAILILVRPRTGLIAVATIIGSDVAINGCFELQDAMVYGVQPPRFYVMFIAQAVFFVFVTATLPFAWQPVRRHASLPS